MRSDIGDLAIQNGKNHRKFPYFRKKYTNYDCYSMVQIIIY